MELALRRIHRHWWIFVVRGILFAALGIYMAFEPAGSFEALGFLFGLIILLAGITELMRIGSDRNRNTRGWHLAVGILEVVLGLVLMSHVAAGMSILRIILGVWFLFRGITMITLSLNSGLSWTVTFGAILIAIFGLLILVDPTFGSLTIILWTALAFVVNGIFNIWLGYRLKL